MADKEQLHILRQGSDAWNAWRAEHPSVRPALSDANLVGANLRNANLSWAFLGGVDLRAAKLSMASLSWADLREANLSAADLSAADLWGVNLFETDLREANLSGVNLSRANLIQTDLRETDCTRARLNGTVFVDVDLSRCKGLETCVHVGPSAIDIHTLQRSGPLPLAFLRGVGLPDSLIDYLPSLLGSAIQLYSCFISYSSQDEDFARRLHADLQDSGVRCWFAPHDMKIGARILDTLDEAIRLRDKVLLVLSAASIASDWVEDEVTKAFAEERRKGGTVLFPMRLDDAVFTTSEAWARKLRDGRHIGDFRGWQDHASYQTTLARLLRDLQIEAA